MASRSPSPPRGRRRSFSRSPQSRSQSQTRSPPPRRGRYDSRSPSRSCSRSMSRSASPLPRRNGRYRSDSRSWSRGRGRDSRDRSLSPPAKSTKIVVERLSKNINEQHLYEIFGTFGHIKDLDLPMNRTFNTNRGTAYILFDHEADAEDAIAHMHEAQVDGATINVSIVLPRRKLSPAPPLARRGANIDPRVPFTGPRGGGFGPGGGGPRRRVSPPASRYGPRSDVYRPGTRSPSRSPVDAQQAREDRYRSRSALSRSPRSRSFTRSPSPPKRYGGGRGRGGARGGGRGFNDGHSRRRSRSPIHTDYPDRSRSRSKGREYR